MKKDKLLRLLGAMTGELNNDFNGYGISASVPVWCNWSSTPHSEMTTPDLDKPSVDTKQLGEFLLAINEQKSIIVESCSQKLVITSLCLQYTDQNGCAWQQLYILLCCALD